MLRIDRLLLRLPSELSGRGTTLARAIGAALADYRAPRSETRPRLAATLHDVSPAMSDGAIADAVAGAVAGRLDGDSGRGGKEWSS
jgi:hypothetical protein